jgi:hypothetical protein
LVGLPVDTPDEVLIRAMHDAAAAIDAAKRDQKVAAAEQRAREEDKRIVLAAVNQGKLPESRIQFWCDALSRDREGNRQIIASLASYIVPTPKLVADAGLEQVHDKVLGRLGITPTRTVAASGHEPTVTGGGATPPPAPPAGEVDAFGFPVPQVPKPVILRRGTNPADYTPEERWRDFAHKLGARFSQNVPRPPAGDEIYIPSPNDFSEFVNGEWRLKNEYREI